jgi:predicted regulator of Ras-like GTPase activity (Roadblock/LC7/MglB family)
MFEDRLRSICDSIDGALAVSLVDADGITVETFGDGSSVDLEALGAELLAQTQTISRDHRELAMGEVRQLSVTTDLYTVLVSALTGNYSLLLVLEEKGGSYGKARFELRRAKLALEHDLA